MAGIPIYESAVLPEWIDYNGHLRDAYYTVILSLACDALMDRVGLDAAYRQRTGCTLYTLEMHLHFLREVKQSDRVAVTVRILDADHKRIHAAFELLRAGHDEPAAAAEMMLLHVAQHDGTAHSTPLPAEVRAALAALATATAALPAAAHGSRRMGLRGTTGTP